MPYKNRKDKQRVQRESKKRHRDRAKKEGLCSNCNRKSLFGYFKCSVCRTKHNEHHKKVYPEYQKKWEKEGRCKYCSRPMLGESKCISCNNRLRDR